MRVLLRESVLYLFGIYRSKTSLQAGLCCLMRFHMLYFRVAFRFVIIGTKSLCIGMLGTQHFFPDGQGALVERLKMPDPEKRVKATFTPEQLQAMLDSCDLGTAMGFRDYTILSLMVDAGLRLSEIVRLTVDDVHPDYVKVYGKGRKEREVGLHPNVSKLLWKYIEKYRKPADKSERALFIGHGKPLGRFGIKDAVNRAKRRCGFEDLEITPHVFRHTFAKEYMDRSGDITSLSRELGHSDIKVTQIYLEDFSSYDARQKHKDRSVFNDIKVQKRKPRNKGQKS